GGGGGGGVGGVGGECRLVDVGRRGKGADRLAFGIGGPQILAQPALVVLDQRVGRVEDAAVRPVVLLELDQLHRCAGNGEVALEVLHVGDVRAAKGVDRLVVVPYGENRCLRRGQQLQPLVLQHVGILELVDQNVRKAAAVMLAQPLVPRQQLVGAQQQLGKIDDAIT